MLELIRELVLELFAPDRRPARAIAQRVARLYHELRNDAVEDHALKVATPRVAHKVLDGLRGLLREEPEVHVAERRVDRRAVGDGRRPASDCRSCGSDGLLLASGSLVEDVAIAGLVPVQP